MEIIRYPNQFNMNTLGMGRVDEGESYRWNKCLLTVDVDDGKLMLNGLSRAVVYLTNEELNDIKDMRTYEFLYRTYFLVKEDFNEIELIDKFKTINQVPVDSLYLNTVNQFTILTTTTCNARCTYCYELFHKNKSKMTNEMAKKVANYIRSKADPKNAIELSWFGGEPLYNMEVIDIIVNNLLKNGFTVRSSFTTNGYLMDEEIADKAISNWGLHYAQITLDGTEEVYNKTKRFIYKEGSPFLKVIKNIKYLLDNGIDVSIRLNVDLSNKEDLLDLIDYIAKNIGQYNNLTIYCWPVFEFENETRTEEQKTELFAGIKAIEDRVIYHRYKFGKNIAEAIINAQCIADSGRQILISPKGNLGLCEHYIDSKFWGNIEDPSIKNYDVLNSWRHYEKRIDICEDCPLFAECIRPTECPEMRKCDKHFKDWRIRQYQHGLLDMYEAYKLENAKRYNILYL